VDDGSVLTVGSLLGVAAGVALSVVFPVLLGYIRRDFVTTAGLPPWVPKYARLVVFSLLTALLVLAVYERTDPETDLTFLGALLLGFGWEASLEKFLRPPLGIQE
jgi:uncharacterized BrkB/YihY/UPF0761 family membrane protein